MRYHSLTVTGVPDDLKIIAWTGDGVIMGVRHRHRPAWGVQFHPESIRTEHGMDLLRNFARLSRDWREHNPANARNPPRSAPAPAIQPTAKKSRRVLVTQQATSAPTELVFQSLYGSSAHSFWLDSSRRNSVLSRFSFLGDCTGPLARIAYADVWRGTVTVHTQQRIEVHHMGFFDWLNNDLRVHSAEVPELPFDFALGWVGYVGYELKAECGGMLAHRSENPDAAMIFADRALAVDHLTGRTYLLALADPDNETSAREWLRSTGAHLDALAGAARPQARGSLDFGHLRLRHDRARYLELIASCQEARRQREGSRGEPDDRRPGAQ